MSIYLVDAFTNQRFAGNRAGVVLNADDYPRDLKQKIATELNASETVFAHRKTPDHFIAEYFTPTTEIDFCGHATIALFHTLAKNGKLSGNATVETKAGTFPVSLTKLGDEIFVTMKQDNSFIATPPCTVQQVAESLRLPEDALDAQFPLGLTRTGNWHLIVGLKNRDFLDQIDYDAAALSQILTRSQAVTANVFCQGSNSTIFHARNFGPTIGIPEDPATGSAAGAFAAYLAHNGLIPEGTHKLKILQGEKMGRPSQIYLTIESAGNVLKQVEIKGTATTSFELMQPPGGRPWKAICGTKTQSVELGLAVGETNTDRPHQSA